MRNLNLSKVFVLLVVALSSVFVSCSKDDETPSDGVDKNASFVGVWTIESTEVSMTVNGGTPYAYFAKQLGTTEAQAKVFVDAMFSEMETNSGTMEFKANGTYESKTNGIVEDTGTWSANADKTKLTTTSSEDDMEMTIDVITLSSSKLVVNMKETEKDGADTIVTSVNMSLKK